MYYCKICGKGFEIKQQLGGHRATCGTVRKKGYKKRTYRGLPIKSKPPKNPFGKCKFCGEQVGRSIYHHVPVCIKNPNREKNIEAHLKNLKRGKDNSSSNPEIRQKIAETAKRKILEGTWHNSFSRARTHIYKGIHFYGTWELKYAKYLDKKKVKWIKNKKTFPYTYEGEEHRYTPDFYLEKEDSYVEIKGYPTEKDRAKWRDFPHPLKVLFGKDLFEMNIINCYRDLETKKDVRRGSVAQ